MNGNGASKESPAGTAPPQPVTNAAHNPASQAPSHSMANTSSNGSVPSQNGNGASSTGSTQQAVITSSAPANGVGASNGAADMSTPLNGNGKAYSNGAAAANNASSASASVAGLPASLNGNGAASLNGTGAAALNGSSGGGSSSPAPAATTTSAAAPAPPTPAPSPSVPTPSSSAPPQAASPAVDGHIELEAVTAPASNQRRLNKTAEGTPYKAPGGRWSNFKNYSVLRVGGDGIGGQADSWLLAVAASSPPVQTWCCWPINLKGEEGVVCVCVLACDVPRAGMRPRSGACTVS